MAYPDPQFISDVIGAEQFGGEAAPIGLGAPPPSQAYAQGTLPSAATPTQGLTAPPQATSLGLGGAAWPTNSLIGAGLGMLGGGWQGGLRGFTSGSAQDLARQQTDIKARQYQQDLALRRAALGQQYDIAMKPQVHIGVVEGPDGYQHPFATMYDPKNGSVRQMSLGDAEKMAGQPGIVTTLPPLYPGGDPIQVPYNVNARKFRDYVDQTRADIATGKISPAQGIAKRSTDLMEAANKELITNDLDKQGTTRMDVIGAAAGTLGKTGEKIAGALLPKDYNRYATAKGTFLDAVASRDPRHDRASLEKTYFPQPGEGKAEIEAKRELRKQAIEDMRASAGPAYRGPQQQQPISAPARTKAVGGKTYYQDNSGDWHDKWPP